MSERKPRAIEMSEADVGQQTSFPAIQFHRVVRRIAVLSNVATYSMRSSEYGWLWSLQSAPCGRTILGFTISGIRTVKMGQRKRGRYPRRVTPEEQIVEVLRQVEAEAKVAKICRKVGISQATYYL